MRVCLYFDPSRLLRWHLWLAQALADLPGSEVSCAFAAARRPLPLSCRLLFELERSIYGLGESGATDPMDAPVRSLPPHEADADGKVDVVIDLAGEELLPAGRRVLTPLFNGVPGEIGVVAAVLNDQDLLVEVHDTGRPLRPWIARPASADRTVFAASLDGALSCAVPLIFKAVTAGSGVLAEPGAQGPRTAAVSVSGLSALSRATGTVVSKATKLLGILAAGGKAWGIGWRFDDSTTLLDKGEAAFSVLTGGTRSYLADPFPVRHNGQDFIFVEEYLYSKNRGCISVVTVNRNGAVGKTQAVLEEPHHLSYPFVFEHDGQIWMIPESGEARNVCLYRAVDFPYRWTREAFLIEGIEAYDATLLRHNGRFWFFVCLRLWKSTSWDALSLYQSDSLTGSWTPHPSNPVLFDAILSRPAGAVFRKGKLSLRPVQDCSRGYGCAVSLCRLDALGETEFAQTLVGRIQCGSFGCHTYNCRSGLEVIDLFGPIRGLQTVAASYQALA